MRPISKKDVEAAVKPYVWDFGNEILYNLCRRHPEHKSEAHVLAKLLLIGRAYSAALERRTKSEEEYGNDFYRAVAWPLIRRANVDIWLAQLKRERNLGSYSSLTIHKRLQNLFFKMT